MSASAALDRLTTTDDGPYAALDRLFRAAVASEQRDVLEPKRPHSVTPEQWAALSPLQRAEVHRVVHEVKAAAKRAQRAVLSPEEREKRRAANATKYKRECARRAEMSPGEREERRAARRAYNTAYVAARRLQKVISDPERLARAYERVERAEARAARSPEDIAKARSERNAKAVAKSRARRAAMSPEEKAAFLAKSAEKTRTRRAALRNMGRAV